jgi:hypothetical protein
VRRFATVITVRFNCVLLCALASGCAQTVKISYPPESVIHPTFDKPYTIWEGERVRVDWTPSLRSESFKYLAKYKRVLLADSIRQKGLRNEYKTAGKGTPLVVSATNRGDDTKVSELSGSREPKWII